MTVGEVENAQERLRYEVDSTMEFINARVKLMDIMHGNGSAKYANGNKRNVGRELSYESLNNNGFKVLFWDESEETIKEMDELQFSKGIGGLIVKRREISDRNTQESDYIPLATLSGYYNEEKKLTWKFPLFDEDNPDKLGSDTHSIDDVLLFKLIPNIEPRREHINNLLDKLESELSQTDGSTNRHDVISEIIRENRNLLLGKITTGIELEFGHNSNNFDGVPEEVVGMTHLGSSSPEYGSKEGEVPVGPMNDNFRAVEYHTAMNTLALINSIYKNNAEPRFIGFLPEELSVTNHPYVETVGAILQAQIEDYPSGFAFAHEFLQRFGVIKNGNYQHNKHAKVFGALADHMHVGGIGANEKMSLELSSRIGHSASSSAILGVTSNARFMNGFCSSNELRIDSFKSLASAGMHDVVTYSNSKEGIVKRTKVLSKGMASTPTRAGAMMDTPNGERSMAHSSLDRIRYETITYEKTGASANPFLAESALFDMYIDTKLVSQKYLDSQENELPDLFYGELSPAQLQENADRLSKDPYSKIITAQIDEDGDNIEMELSNFFIEKASYLIEMFPERREEIERNYERLIRNSTKPENSNIFSYLGLPIMEDEEVDQLVENLKSGNIIYVIKILDDSNLTGDYMVGNLGDIIKNEWLSRGKSLNSKSEDNIIEYGDQDIELQDRLINVISIGSIVDSVRKLKALGMRQDRIIQFIQEDRKKRAA